jgi:hypothetical protein
MKSSYLKHISLAILVMFLSIMSLSTGCATGVSETDYSLMKNELLATKAELETLKAQASSSSTSSGDFAKVAMYAEINDRCIDAWRVLYGDPSKYGYTKGDVVKWASDLDAKIAAVNDAVLIILWKSYVTATPGADQLKKGVTMLSYLSDKLRALTAGK